MPKPPDSIFPQELCSLHVAGVSFRDGYPDHLWRIKDQLLRSNEVPAHLEPDPDNEADSLAVRVYVRKRWVGYLSRADAQRYHNTLATGREVRAFVDRVVGETDPGLWITVEPG